LYGIRLFALGGQVALARFSAVEFSLNRLQIELQPCGTSVDNPTNGFAVRFAEGGQFKESPEAVSRHAAKDRNLSSLKISLSFLFSHLCGE
jgi:hypothetical protein